MKFKKILIIFLCVSLLSAFSVSCFATSQGSYGFYISPGEYVFGELLVGDYSFTLNSLLSDSNIVFFVNSSNYFGLRYLSYADYENAYYLSLEDTTGTNLFVYDTRSGGWLSNDYRFIDVVNGFYIYDINVYQWWQSNLTRVSPGYNSSFFDNMLSIFTAIGQWISGAAANLTSMFFVDNSLTFVGTLCVAALSMAVAFLIIGLISRFLRFRA